MPRPPQQRKPKEELTPFARRLADYMSAQWPPMTVPELASLTGISAQAIYDYFNKDVVPRATTLELIAEKTSIPVADLFAAAGLPQPPTGWDKIEREIEDLHLPERDRADLLRCLDGVRAKYEATASRG